MALPPPWPGEAEVGARIARLCANMADANVDAMILTSRQNFDYYSGFRTLLDSRYQAAVSDCAT
ncbi:aminopeptidase P family N-terminal domain-containing protein [Bradyrhizobium sp. RT9a]|uniref:aminopeptidase P family N-terminal domain-containing protein n=1 Tax=Bradyrhizobium sp. RT9a TaxID=3156384 RepID=UPI003393AE72